MSLPTTKRDKSIARTQALARFQIWRGATIEHFAKVEAMASEILATLVEQQEMCALQLAGKRYGELARLLDVPDSANAKKVRKLLIAFQSEFHDQVRNRVCHRTAQIRQDSKNRWVATFGGHLFRDNQPSNLPEQLTEDQADAELLRLKKAADELRAALGQIRRWGLSPQSPSTGTA